MGRVTSAGSKKQAAHNRAASLDMQKMTAKSIVAHGTHERQLKSITEQLYKRNLELAVRNKTLSLLRELYSISIQTLEVGALSTKIAQVVRERLNLEIVGILLFDDKRKQLIPSGFAFSDRLRAAGQVLPQSSVTVDVTDHFLLAQVVQRKDRIEHASLEMFWQPALSADAATWLKEKGNVKASVGYPLIIGDEVIGVFAISLNRRYKSLPQYERDSLANFANVIAVAIDKATLYRQLTVANRQLAETNAKLKKLDQAKSEFISIASHQLRTPLTVIKGYVSMMIEGSFGTLTKAAVESLHKVYESNQRLITLVEDLLNISRIESGRLQFNWSDARLEDMLASIVDELTQNAAKKKLKLEFVPPPAPLSLVTMDEDKLRQVFMNLVDNAVKYTDKGNVRVTVAEDQGMVTAAVTDTGMGIDSDDMGNLFQKFSRGKGMSLVHTEGTGLGLYVAKEMVGAHGGKIWAESPGKGKGSTFRVSLPTAAKAAKQAKTLATRAKAKTTAAKR